jgi:hypothetical protein
MERREGRNEQMKERCKLYHACFFHAGIKNAAYTEL